MDHNRALARAGSTGRLAAKMRGDRHSRHSPSPDEDASQEAVAVHRKATLRFRALSEAGIPLGHAPTRRPTRDHVEYHPHMNRAQLADDRVARRGYECPRVTWEHGDCEDDGYYGYHGVSGVHADHKDTSCVGPDEADFALKAPVWHPCDGTDEADTQRKRCVAGLAGPAYFASANVSATGAQEAHAHSAGQVVRENTLQDGNCAESMSLTR